MFYQISIDASTPILYIHSLYKFIQIEEIIENLKAENSSFGDYCLKKIKERSGISLGVTLKLLRNAKKLSFDETIRQELGVVRNIIVSLIKLIIYKA